MSRSFLQERLESREDKVACAWGFAEATLFFIVPDVWLSFVARKGAKAALKASAWAVVGAVAGGLVMLAWGARSPESARAAVNSLPGVSASMPELVRSQLEVYGESAMLRGPARGVPYKLYAVEWGVRGWPLRRFVFASTYARAPRFVLVSLLVAGLFALTRRFLGERPVLEKGAIAASWTVFYAWFLFLR